MALSTFLRGFLLGTIVLGGCGNKDDDAPACVADQSKSCMPLYDPPTFSTIFDKILQPSCSEGIATCHTAEGAKGGLVFENVDDSYALLLGQRGGRARVIPNDPGCSLVVIKLKSTDPNFRMPPGNTAYPEPEVCVIEQWIAQGAKR